MVRAGEIIFILIFLVGCATKISEPIQYSPSSPPKDMVYIKGGVFMMGLDGYAGNYYMQTSPLHPVSVSSFYIGTSEFTLHTENEVDEGSLEYAAKLEETKNRISPHYWAELDEIRSKAVSTSYYNAVLYCNRKSKRDGLEKVYEIEEDKDESIINIKTHYDRIGYRLPTEAEWEYAARGGMATTYFWGDTFELYTEYEQAPLSSKEPEMVKQLKPNPFGLYDILSNVPELCNDLYDPDFYTPYSVYNPRNYDTTGQVIDEMGNQRMVAFRGGAFKGANVVGPEFNPGFREGVGMRYPGMKVGYRIVLPTNDTPPTIPDSLLEEYPLRKKVFGPVPLTFEDLVQSGSSSKIELYNRAQLWFRTEFNNDNNVLQEENKKEGQLIGKGVIEYNPPVTVVAEKGKIEYTINVFVENGSYKYEITNFIHSSYVNQNIDYSLGLITTKEESDKPAGTVLKNEFDVTWRDIKAQIEKNILPLIINLKQSMTKEITKLEAN